MSNLKSYSGRIPACGVFCGGCPVYVRDKKSCPGAELNSERCENCKSFHICTREKGLKHCCDCKSFPCRRFRDFAGRWKKYGQDLIENQKLLREKGEAGFLKLFNKSTKS